MTEHPDDDSSASPRLESDAVDSFDSLVREAAEALDVSSSEAAVARGDRGNSGPRSNPSLLAEGALIAERYRLLHRLGQGGMGEVWAATHTITRRRVALKFLKGSMSMRADLRLRFLREARAVSLVRHPCVVEVLDVFELEDGMPVMVMELLVGETLGDRLAGGTALPLSQVVELMLPAVDAVQAAHARGIVHRDLKPDNIFLERSDAGRVAVKVLDFGIAKLTAKEGDAAETGSLTGSGSVLGTPSYMAPEQLWSDKEIDARADIWALGVILYECLAGRRPLEGSSVGQLVKELHCGAVVPVEERVPGIDPELARTVGQMLSRERADRQSDLVAVRQLLARLAARASSTPQDPLQIHAALADTQSAPAKWDTGVPHAVSTQRRPASASGLPRVVAGVALVIAAAGGWLFHSSSKLIGETNPSGTPALPTANGVPLPSRGAVAVASAVGVSTSPVAPDLDGVPATSEPSSAPSAHPGTRPVVAAASSRPSKPAAPPHGAAHRGTVAEKDVPTAASSGPPPSASARHKNHEGGLFDEVPF